MSRPTQTLVLSDIHLSDAEDSHPGKSLWKRYKRSKYFIDRSFSNLLSKFVREVEGPLELVLNGDIFDFDSVMALPKHTTVHISWLEKRRGLYPEEEKSRFKMQTILEDHPIWVQAIHDFLKAGNSLVVIIGNHDLELHWPSVQHEFVKTLALSEEISNKIRFCEWFYISESDTYIEHGNQYDDYCVATNPVHPLIKKGKQVQVRLPFGNISGRIMVNGMGLINPHVESSYLMSLREYVKFFYRYALRVQPFLPFTWAWSAMVTFWYSMVDGLLPAMRDPLYTEARVEEIARKANATPHIVRTLREIHVHPAIFKPLKIIRELWLDRLFILVALVFLSLQVYVIMRAFVPISLIWWLAIFILFTPVLFYYSRHIESEVFKSQEVAIRQAPLIHKITGAKRVIFGHTHRQVHTEIEGVEVINTGTWSPAFKDPECTEAFGQKCFAWINKDGEAKLYLWRDPEFEEIPKER